MNDIEYLVYRRKAINWAKNRATHGRVDVSYCASTDEFETYLDEVSKGAKRLRVIESSYERVPEGYQRVPLYDLLPTHDEFLSNLKVVSVLRS